MFATSPVSAVTVRSGNTVVDLSTMQQANPQPANPAICETDVELITNGGFETGSLSPWTSSAWSVVNNGPHTGTYCAYDIGNNFIIQNLTPTPAANITSATIWMRQPEAAISAIDWMYQGGTYSEDLVFLSSANWTQFNIASFIDPGTTVIGLRIWGYSGGGPGPDETFLDDVSVQTAGGGQSLDVEITPVNPPIVIPQGGGSFSLNATVSRTLGPQSPFFVWSRDRFPDGTYSAPLLGPVQINPPVGALVTRLRVQNVPSTWPAGTHWYIAYANPTFSYPTVDADSFPWTKSSDLDLGPVVLDAACYGELFPGEIATLSNQPSVISLKGTYPNPFNPTTTIRYQLSAFSNVSLKVYDTAGQLVSTLVNRTQGAGNYGITFDGSHLASGVYLYRLEAGGQSMVGKMVLMK